MRAVANGHHVVALTTIIVIISLALQPLAAALLTIQDTRWTETGAYKLYYVSPPTDRSLNRGVVVNNLAAIGLNQNSEFQDLTSETIVG